MCIAVSGIDLSKSMSILENYKVEFLNSTNKK